MSFRKVGGVQYSATQNVVKSRYNTTDNLYVNKYVGEPNTVIDFLSDISGNITIYGDLDVSGNVHVSGDIDCSGNVHVSGDIDCSGNVHISGDIDCSGNVNVDGNVTAEYMFLSSGTTYTTAANGVVPKSYVDTFATGLKILPPCVLCSNAAPPLFKSSMSVSNSSN